VLYNVAGNDTLCTRVHWPFGVSLKETMLLFLSLCIRRTKTHFFSISSERERKWGTCTEFLAAQHIGSPNNYVSWVCREAFLHRRCGQRWNGRILRPISCFARESVFLVSIILLEYSIPCNCSNYCLPLCPCCMW